MASIALGFTQNKVAKFESVIRSNTDVYEMIYGFNNVDDFIRDMTNNKYAFKRILLSIDAIDKEDPEGSLKRLYDALKTYSDATEIVYVGYAKDMNSRSIQRVFENVFNSPLYTCFEFRQQTAKIFMGLVEDPIQKIAEEQVRKNSSEDSKSSEPAGSNIKEPEKVEVSVEKEAEKLESEKNDLSTSNSEENASSSPISEPRESFNFGSFMEGVGTSWESIGSPEDFNISGEDLSLGEEGLNHSDTGFMNEDEDIDEPSKSDSVSQEDSSDWRDLPGSSSGEGSPANQGGDQSSENRVDTSFKAEEEEPVKIHEEPVKEKGNRSTTDSNEKVKDGLVKEKQSCIFNAAKNTQAIEDRFLVSRKKVNPTNRKIDICISSRSVNISQDIIDTCSKVVKDGSSVLLVDLDFRDNRTLGYFNLEKYYSRGCSMGIKSIKAYAEDGVSLASNGYGARICVDDLIKFVSSPILRSYDMIYIDCPIDCLSVMPESLLDKCNILLNPGKSFTDYLTTTRELTSRQFTTLIQEATIMKNCLLDMGNYRKMELKEFSEMCFMPNGSWVDRVGL